MASSQDVIHTTVLILGGGVSGITAAKTLAGEGITNFKIIEARDELGGRLRSERFGVKGREVTVEVRWYSSPSKSLHRTFTDPFRSLARTGFKELAMEIAKTLSGPLSKNIVSRHESATTSVSTIPTTPVCGIVVSS